MRLYGNIVNRTLEDYNPATAPQPVVNGKITQMCWSDRRVHTILALWGSRRLLLRRDRIVPGGTIEYPHTETDYDGAETVVSRRKDGHYYRVGETMKSDRYVIGNFGEHYDRHL